MFHHAMESRSRPARLQFIRSTLLLSYSHLNYTRTGPEEFIADDASM